jgi:AcrR family transcriptional regulator
MNKIQKRTLKEQAIIKAAEKVFNQKGYVNTKMEDIASEMGVSKGTVYFYFSSKENLYMAITFRAYEMIIDIFQRTIYNHRNEKGIESVVAIMKAFMDFAENNFLYSEALLDYYSFERSTGQGIDFKKLTEGMKDSLFYQKVKSIQNMPIEITIKEIERGIFDGSIRNGVKPQMIYLQAWALIIGYLKLNDTSITKRDTILKVNVQDWKNYIIKESRNMIKV